MAQNDAVVLFHTGGKLDKELQLFPSLEVKKSVLVSV